MMSVLVILTIMAGGLAVIATAKSLVRAIIGAEMLTLAAIYAAAVARDLNMLAVAAAIGVVETVMLVSTLFKMAKEGYV
ncbi:ferredoxin:quinone oxidoreductase [Pyrobaculum aerophilum]|uniref:Ferredoxin:quinone oxidoreductase n=1 Tax=Pyrobaculum aerophilum TaxID=13773 RepID=A0A371R5Z8_9CREN|nr:ferredoxin:quinone oxidoreductase [Pyrobaculum aerophilum]RFA97684.1 ferredoxin:quinone oxidoreductase [Pyrobaculum aerophilum]RFA99496.1 ferredoxin:quinone oxidoreductase [Pyrobaculum aerophilum]